MIIFVLHVHLSYLLRSLFQNTTGQRNDVFHLVIQDVGGMGQVLDYMYTSHLELNQDNVQALLDIALYLQMPNILSMCNSFPKSCASTVDASTLSMPGVLGHEQGCMLGGNLPPEIDILPTETQRSLNCSTEDGKSKEDSHIQRNIPIDVVTNVPAAPIKQPLPGYKLRSFYSKQYFKESAVETCYSPSMPNQNHALVEVTNDTFDPTPACQGSAIPVGQDTSMPAPRGSSSVAPDPMYPPACKSPVSRPVRPKKALYLKKYNYLCSERTVVKMHISKSPFTDHCVNEGPQEEPEQSQLADSLDERVGPENVEDSELGPSQPVSMSPTLNAVETCSELNRGPPAGETGNKKDYCCEICRKTFKHPSNLELHKRSHTGM